jgi:NAD(P) transhydrogenase subunit alpha
MIRNLQKNNITALTMDSIPRISRAQRMDALSSMSAVTGYKSVIMAANRLPKFIPMIGTAIGTIKPANFLIIGIGVVGLQAIATAKRLGGVVKTLDIRKAASIEGDSLGGKVIDFDIPQELATGHGGYAKSLDNNWLVKERRLIASHLKDVDVVILSALVPGEVAPILITEDMVADMNPGSIIIDVSVDQGGNCAMTEPGSFIQKHGVHICGIQNIPGSVAVHSSWLYANNMYYYVENLFKKSIGEIDFDDEIVKSSLVTYQSKIVHEGTLKAMK